VVEFGVAVGDVAFFCGPSGINADDSGRRGGGGGYSIASFMMRCLFGSDGSVIPSSCTIRARSQCRE
jgi:hypothetical protein